MQQIQEPPQQKSTVNGSVDLSKVLVVALHQQPPAQDNTIRGTLEGLLELYQRRLVFRSGGGDWFTKVPDEPHLRFYEPVTSLLWGSYDHATFYLADDLESVVHVASSSGATAQEFIFGSPYDFPADGPREERGLIQLLSPARSGRHPFLSVSRIKLPDYLLCLGARSLRAAMARRVHAIAESAGVVPVILRCWSWPELACILLADRPSPLLTTARAIESTTVGNLRADDPEFEAAFRSALTDHRVGKEITRLWIDGPPEEPHEPYEPLREAENPNLLDERHAVVAAKSQIGILEPSWSGLACSLPECLREVGTRAFRRPDPAEMFAEPGPGEARTVEPEFDAYRDALTKTSRSRDEIPHPFVARISILVKPGHLPQVRWYLQRLTRNLPDELTLRSGIDGEGTTLLLFVRLADEPSAFARLLTITHWLRVWKPLRPHILDVTTLLEEVEPAATIEAEGSPPPPLPDHLAGQSGYRLLHRLPSDEARAFGRYRAKLKGLGRVESRSLHAWMAALGHTASRPEMYGAMMELQTAASGAYNEIVYAREEHGYSHLSERVRDLLRHGRTAYNQRLQFSPVMRGAPPISGQLPYGINQIVGMLDGLAASIIQVARADDPTASEQARSTRTIVVFEPDAAIGTRQVLNLTVLTVNLLQALSPVSLCLLFHELGHVVADQIWARRHRPPEQRTGLDRGRWRESRRLTIEMMTDLYCDSEEEGANRIAARFRRRVRRRVRRFLDDIFPHAVWRRLGCGGDFDLFTTQFLAGQAMGLRTESDPHDPMVSLVAWAETAVHLTIQQLLEDEGEDVQRAVSRLGNEEEQRARLVEKLPKVLEYGETELGDAAVALKSSTDELQRKLESLCSWWISMLALVCDPERNAPKSYWAHLAVLMDRLKQIENRIEHVAERLLNDPGSEYATIVERIRTGRPAPAPWSVVSDDFRPTDEAFLWARQILRAVAEDFEAGHRGGISLQSFRERALNPDGARMPDPLETGLYTDHTGGLTAVGRDRRLQYLKLGNAAFESLWELTSRIMAGRIRRFLVRRRDFERIESEGYARVRIGGRVKKVPLRDYSPIGFSLGPADKLSGLEVGEQLEIERKDGRWLWSSITWTGDEEGPIIGAVLEGPDGRAPGSRPGALISGRLQMDPHWVEVHEP